MNTVPTTNLTPHVRVKVQRLLPFGLLVALEDGQVGLIREREIAWDRQVRRHWRKRFRVGDVLEAVLIGTGHEQRLELSLRLSEADPWVTLAQRYRLGQRVEGSVTGVQPYGVFIEIEAGITGLLHVSRLPLWVQQRDPTELFLVGDRVRVVIEHIDPQDRRIGLSLTRALTERWSDQETTQDNTPSASATSSTNADAEVPPSSEPDLTPEMTSSIPPLTLLVVEDDPIQLNAIKKWLQNEHVIYAASTAEDGLAYLDTAQPDAVLMDFGLPGIDGIEALQRIERRFPNVRRILMTDWARANEHIQELDVLRANRTQLMIKPLIPSDVEFALLEALVSHDSIADEEENEPASERVQLVNVVDNLFQNKFAQHRILDSILGHLLHVTHAGKVVFFRLDPAQRKTEIFAQSGTLELHSEALVDLIYSPVRDVAEDQRIFRVEDVQHVAPRVRYLKPLINFRSCLGLPVPTRIAYSFALFLFGAHPHAFNDVHEHYASAAAFALGSIIEQEEFREHAHTMQRLALLGQLSRALVHEINHQLSPVNFTLADMEQQCRALEQAVQIEPVQLDERLDTLSRTVRELQMSVKHLTETARLFGQVALQQKESRTDLRVLIQQATEMVQDSADRAHVRIDVRFTHTIDIIQVQSAQVQQMLLNLLINAIQQIELLRPSGPGRIVVRVQQQNLPRGSTIQIQIEDDAGGIHREYWERVFELGFTTRRESGSGMGLHITRSLVEALGGRVFIQESLMLWGTIFVLELPLVV